jgi:hypothetical protein
LLAGRRDNPELNVGGAKALLVSTVDRNGVNQICSDFPPPVRIGDNLGAVVTGGVGMATFRHSRRMTQAQMIAVAFAAMCPLATWTVLIALFFAGELGG